MVKKYKYIPVLSEKSNIQKVEKEMKQQGVKDVRKELFSKIANLRSIADFGLLSMYYAEIDGKMEHYFIKDNSLVEFLETTEVKKGCNISEYVLQNGFKYDAPSGIPELDNLTEKFIAIHTKRYSFIVRLDVSSLKNLAVFRVYDESFDRTFLMDLSKFENDEITGDEKSEPYMKYANMFANFIFYIGAFPDCVLDGLPNDYQVDRNNFTVKNKKVGIAPKIIHHTDGNKCPHFRCGHFRYLGSDFYKNKKGTTIFVEATVVKGHAKTVIEQTA